MHYPETRRTDCADERFGIRTADPFRWLENDVRGDAEVEAWVDAQNTVSGDYLSGLPGRAIFRRRLSALFDHERLTVPEKRNGRYFFTRNAGLDNQPVLVVREGVEGKDRVLLDPNAWSRDGTEALAEWAPSPDGRHVAFAIQRHGADWRTIRILDVDSGVTLDDEVAWARFTSLAWMKDGSGFFYGRNPEPEKGASFGAPVLDHAIAFHRIGTARSEDRVVHAPHSERPLNHAVQETPDGRYLVIYSMASAGGNALSVIDLADPAWTVRPIVEALDTPWTYAGNAGTRFYLVTQDGAERGRLVWLDLAQPEAAAVELVAERPDAVLHFAGLVGNALLLTYTVDAKTDVRRFTLDGRPDGGVDLPGVGTAGPFHGHPDDDEAFFSFTGHDTPGRIYRYDMAARRRTLWAEPEAHAALDRIVVEQRFYRSKDGTRVPIFIMRRRDVSTPAPAILYAYGGFGIAMVPYYAPAAVAWVEQGGVYAVANIRGGGEYGRAWHEAARGRGRQNAFDDFIAAAEFLKAEGLATDGGLAIHGESNGGLLVGAVVNQRPDLYAAALPGVGVMDMLRFDRFTSGHFWMHEFGDPSVEADFRNLLSYSPLHTIRSGVAYPAILATTADTDDRVVPAHSFKYVAALQAADLGPRPRLLRVETRAGHGAGQPVEKMIDMTADMWAFAAHWTGLQVKDA